MKSTLSRLLRHLVFGFSFLLFGLASGRAEDILHRFLCCDYNGDQVCLVSAEGKIEWRAEAKHPQDCWLLPNGNVLFAHLSGAREVTMKNEVVWEYVNPVFNTHPKIGILNSLFRARRYDRDGVELKGRI